MYNISFKVKVEGTVDTYVYTGYCDAAITWHAREMICESTGLEWNNEENNGYVKDIVPKIEKGYFELVNHPGKYKKYKSSTKWGTVKGTSLFFNEILSAWEQMQQYDPELAAVATFWIE